MSTPFLFVIARGDTKRLDHIRALFGTRSEVQIVGDRRRGERRAGCGARAGAEERRRRERRIHDSSRDLSQQGWAYVESRESARSGWSRTVGQLIDQPRYAYYRGSIAPQGRTHTRQAAALSQELFAPALRNAQFLVLRERSKILSRWIEKLPKTGLDVLDVGGRLQPYRAVLENRLHSYTAIDPVFEGLLDVVAVAEHLPFRSEAFDLAICTQVLNYISNPLQAIAEIYRVLRPGGAVILSVPVWRLKPEDLDVLLAPFALAQVVPEGGSVAGLCSVFNMVLEKKIFDRAPFDNRVWGWRARATVFSVTNLAGLVLDPLCRSRRFTANYSCVGFKWPGM